MKKQLYRSVTVIPLLLTWISLSCPAQQPVADIEGNLYQTVVIGSRVWMAENLKTTKFRDGTGIPEVTDSVLWGGTSFPAYCWYENTAVWRDQLGALYNWRAVATGLLAPEGWHVPTDSEWNELAGLYGGTLLAGGALKSEETVETGNGYWFTPNTGADNRSGFSARGAGAREADGQFHYLYSQGLWWSAWSATGGSALGRQAGYNNSALQMVIMPMQTGMSVRCVRDAPAGEEDATPAGTLRLFPNPALGHTCLAGSLPGPVLVKVSDLSGRIVLNASISPDQPCFSLHSLSPGMYLLRSTLAATSVTTRLLVLPR